MVKYLVSIIDSIGSLAAFESALDSMNKAEDELLLLNVVIKDCLLFSEQFGFVDKSSEFYEVVLNQKKEEARMILLNFEEQAKRRGVRKVSLFIRTEIYIGEAIVEVAERQKVQYLFVGSRGMRKMTHLILGRESISRYVIHHAPLNCNVIVVRRIKNMNVVQKVKYESGMVHEKLTSNENTNPKSSSFYIPRKTGKESQFNGKKSRKYKDFNEILI